MPYHGNTHQQVEQSESDAEPEDDNMSLYAVYYDSPVGAGREKIRAVTDTEAMKLVEDRGHNVTANDAEEVEG